MARKSFFCLWILCFFSVPALGFEVQIAKGSHIIQHLEGAPTPNNFFMFRMNSVAKFLPASYSLSEHAKGLVKKAPHDPAAYLILKKWSKLVRHHSFKPWFFSSPEQFFTQPIYFPFGAKFTYVILDDSMIFSETASIPGKDRLRDLASKHYLLAGTQNSVRYAGEMKIAVRPNGWIEIVLDNSSGTYSPSDKDLHRVAQLVQHAVAPYNSQNNNEMTSPVVVTPCTYSQKLACSAFSGMDAY